MPPAPSSSAKHAHLSPAKHVNAALSAKMISFRPSASSVAALRRTRRAIEATRSALTDSAQVIYGLETEYLTLAGGLARLRDTAASVDSSSISKARDYLQAPLEAPEVAYLVNSGASTSERDKTAKSLGKANHGWAVVGQGTMTTTSAQQAFAANVLSDPCRWISLTYGPTISLLEDARSRQQLNTRFGVAADAVVAQSLRSLKDPSATANHEDTYHHPMWHIRDDM